MALLISFAALFVSIALMQLGAGTMGPLDALAGSVKGFTNGEIGLLGSAHFLGFMLGCLAAPGLMARVGHARTFAAMASIGAIAAILHPVFPDPVVWAILRVFVGACVAASYTVVESWLQAKLENAERGRVLSVYRVVDLIGQLAAQMMIAFLDPASYVAYNIVACFFCLCLLPLALTTSVAPPQPKTPKIRVLRAIMLSPLGAAGVLTVGLTNSSFRMVGPIYGQENGLDSTQIALFLASAILGGAIAQPLAGWLSDKYDRRWVLIVVSIAALCVCGFIASRPAEQSFNELLFASFLFGMAALPLFSISAAHANDFSPKDFVVELNASLVLIFGIGAVAGPVVASALIEAYGPSAMFLYIAAAHIGLILFGLFRMTRRPTTSPDARAPYRYRPRTSITLERLLHRRDKDED